MKKVLLLVLLLFINNIIFAQCVPNPLYQDSLYDIWPDTIINLPNATQGVPYYTILDIKTPTTLIEASGGDSALTSIDTLGQTFYVGSWPVDSMELVQVAGLPNGLVLNCQPNSNCILPGNILACAEISGTTNDPPGVYPIEIKVNVYTNGNITYFIGPIPITVPVSTDLYSATGDYEKIVGYKIIIDPLSNVKIFNSNEFNLFQNFPNPAKNSFEIKFNSPIRDNYVFSVTDVMGKLIFSSNIKSKIGVNTIFVEKDLPNGIYNYSINNGEIYLSKKMIISR